MKWRALQVRVVGRLAYSQGSYGGQITHGQVTKGAIYCELAR